MINWLFYSQALYKENKRTLSRTQKKEGLREKSGAHARLSGRIEKEGLIMFLNVSSS
jgi:hypothetical protein